MDIDCWYGIFEKEKNTSFHLGVVAGEEISCSDHPSKVTLGSAVGKWGAHALPRSASSAFQVVLCEMLIVCTLIRYNV